MEYCKNVGQTRLPGVDDYIMFSPATQTPIQRKLSYSPDTEETLRLATQKLKQPVAASQQQQQSGIPHAYVIPVPIVPSDNLQGISIAAQSTSSANQEDAVVNGTTQQQPQIYQYGGNVVTDISTQVGIKELPN